MALFFERLAPPLSLRIPKIRINYLQGAKRRRDDGYDAGTRCDTLSDFLQLAPTIAPRTAAPAWIALDNAHRLAGTDLLAALARIRDSTGANIGVILISSVPWAGGRFSRDSHGAPAPVQVAFPAYSPDQLLAILEARGGTRSGTKEAALWRHFLRAFVPAFGRASNNLLDVSSAAEPLFAKYVTPALAPGAGDVAPAKLYKGIRADVAKLVHTLEVPVAAQPSSSSSAAIAAGYDAPTTPAPGDALRRAGGWHSLELPYMSKFLLLAAYVASRNRPTVDRAVFDPTHGRRARRDAQAQDRAAEAALEAQLRGPHSFYLERLLHIFFCMYAQRDEDEERVVEHQENGGSAGMRTAKGVATGLRNEATAGARPELQAEVLMQVSTLCTLGLLSCCGGDLLEGCSYRCGLEDEAARAVAENVGLRLGDYLKLS
jgi:origin recognition complex subunit 5